MAVQQEPSTSNPPKTLPRAWYCDPAIFEIELEHVFRQQWWLVAREAQLNEIGRYLAVTSGKWPLVIVRDQSGIKGFHNVCRHRAGPLVREGRGTCTAFVCRYHGWRYDTSGRLLNATGLRDGSDLDYSQHSLFPIRIDTWNGLVFACLDSTTPSLRDWLGDIVKIAEAFPGSAGMDWHGEIEKSGQMNWKTYADNACEGYHLKMVHKSLGQAVAGDRVDIRPYENGQFVGFDVLYSATESDKTRAGRGFWVYKFPALSMVFSEFSFNVESLVPVSPGEIKLTRWFWIDSDEAGVRNVCGDDILASTDQIMREDMDICALVQRNLEAEIYQCGRLSPDHESGTIYFQQWIRDALGDHVVER